MELIGDMERFITAAKRVKADNFIKLLPRQYDDILSKLFENGQELSLGQWQSICLARLFMKRSSVLIFDEPTASLDIETEAHLFREITQLTKNKICILISHHMLRRGIADKIVVLDNGEIAEVGTHEYLVTQNGKFAKLLNLYHNTPKELFVNL
jgi:ATP-binding cassette subfamily B protein